MEKEKAECKALRIHNVPQTLTVHCMLSTLYSMYTLYTPFSCWPGPHSRGHWDHQHQLTLDQRQSECECTVPQRLCVCACAMSGCYGRCRVMCTYVCTSTHIHVSISLREQDQQSALNYSTYSTFKTNYFFHTTSTVHPMFTYPPLTLIGCREAIDGGQRHRR